MRGCIITWPESSKITEEMVQAGLGPNVTIRTVSHEYPTKRWSITLNGDGLPDWCGFSWPVVEWGFGIGSSPVAVILLKDNMAYPLKEPTRPVKSERFYAATPMAGVFAMDISARPYLQVLAEGAGIRITWSGEDPQFSASDLRMIRGEIIDCIESRIRLAEKREAEPSSRDHQPKFLLKSDHSITGDDIGGGWNGSERLHYIKSSVVDTGFITDTEFYCDRKEKS